jgi:uncharacterized DUF497 family protein
MRRHDRFEWDEDKARTNARKHRVTFADAAAMLADPMYEMFHVEQFDQDHSDAEERYVTYGTDPLDRSVVLAVVWTERDQATRLISARFATPAERRTYEAEIERRQNRP